MISDKLFELAFAYKKTKLWKYLWDSEIFAVRLPDGEIGYCSIMGAVGQHYALGLYVGEEGFNSFRIVMSGPSMLSELNYHEFLLSQNCLQCAFENKDELAAEEVEEVREYARRNKISLRGRNAFPHFVKFKPNYLPWFLRDEKEKLYLCEALSAAIAVAARLEKQSKAEIGLEQVVSSTESVPLLERKGDAYSWSRTELPPAVPIQYPKPDFVNDIAAAKLRHMKKAGMWECQVIRFPEPMQESPEQAPYFPVILLAVSGSSEQVLPPQLSQHYDEEPEELVDQFAEMFIEQQLRPAMLSVKDERTKVLLEDFCERAGIRIRVCEDLPLLEEAMDSFMEYLGIHDTAADSIGEILDMLLQLDDGELGNLPDEIRQQFASILEQENLPDELTDQLAEKLHVNVGKETAWLEQSYVISVSCRKGCYRHIQISGSDTLEDLHEAIQAAFAFDNDHAYAFFMDNALWSGLDAYYAPGMEEEDRTTDSYRLDQLGLTVGRQFKYLFDFGDEWVFQCRVLRVLDQKTETPEVVRLQGDPPEQY